MQCFLVEGVRSFYILTEMVQVPLGSVTYPCLQTQSHLRGSKVKEAVNRSPSPFTSIYLPVSVSFAV